MIIIYNHKHTYASRQPTASGTLSRQLRPALSTALLSSGTRIFVIFRFKCLYYSNRDSHPRSSLVFFFPDVFLAWLESEPEHQKPESDTVESIIFVTSAGRDV